MIRFLLKDKPRVRFLSMAVWAGIAALVISLYFYGFQREVGINIGRVGGDNIAPPIPLVPSLVYRNLTSYPWYSFLQYVLVYLGGPLASALNFPFTLFNEPSRTMLTGTFGILVFLFSSVMVLRMKIGQRGGWLPYLGWTL